jgi:hypothetical protein
VCEDQGYEDRYGKFHEIRAKKRGQVRSYLSMMHRNHFKIEFGG